MALPRYLSPAGSPIRATDLVRWAARALTPGDVAAQLRDAARSRFGVEHAFLMSTGRAGLTVLLRAMKRLAPADRDEVILPSYTCYSVAASVLKAGLRPRIVDVSPETLDYAVDDLARADFSRALALIATNLYGMPNDLPALTRLARAHGVFVIDDAAQAMGASVGGRASGTWGDAGLFSFDKGKNVSAIDGGLVVTNSGDIAGALRDEARSLSAPGLVESGLGVAKALVYAALLRPELYWIPNGIPQLELGKTAFTMDFPLHGPSRPLTALAVAMMTRLDAFTRARTGNASALLAGLDGLPGVRAVTPGAQAVPVYLRLPVLVDTPEARDRMLSRLNHAGIGASASYPSSIADIPELQGRFAGNARPAGGRYVAERIVTLPTHGFVRPADVERTLQLVARDAESPVHGWQTATAAVAPPRGLTGTDRAERI
jgi:dTDP-4-amino-4,6-dideoxygalactose transaminase